MVLEYVNPKTYAILYQTTHYILAVEYLFLTFAASYFLSNIAKHGANNNYKVLFFVLIVVGSTCRFCDFIILSMLSSGSIVMSNTYGFFIIVSPAWIYFTAYGVLLLEWTCMLVTIRAVTNSGNASTIRRNLVIISVVFFIFLYAFITSMCACSIIIGGIQEPSVVPHTENIYQAIISGSDSLLYSLVSLLFFFIGILLIREFKTNILLSGKNQSKVFWRMITVVFVVPAIFLMRMVMVLVDVWINLSAYWWMDLFYYTIYEFLPILCLCVLSRKSKGSQELSSDKE